MALVMLGGLFMGTIIRFRSRHESFCGTVWGIGCDARVDSKSIVKLL